MTRGASIKAALINGTTRAEIHRFIMETTNPHSTLYTDDHAS